MLEYLRNLLTNLSTGSETQGGVTGSLAAAVVILITAAVAFFVVRFLLRRIIVRAIARTAPEWGKVVVKHKVFHRLAYTAPTVVVALTTPFAFASQPQLVAFISGVNSFIFVIVVVLVINAGLNAFLDIYNTYELSKAVPLVSFVQIVKLGLYLLAGFFVLSLLLNIPLVYLLSGLGALLAVGGFVFKDPILGFVAGIQLAANQMVAIGDWIEMPEYGADGEVLEINLTTVKVRNFDMTITTVPTYDLISRSFKNWRGMEESGGRRVKKAIHIDINTIKVCTEALLASLANIEYIPADIFQQGQALVQTEGRPVTNLTLLRAYIYHYLKHSPLINPDMWLMVRLQAPTEYGLPVEIYAFCRAQGYPHFWSAHSEIFDHILTVIPYFELKVFQSPSGVDFNRLAQSLQTNPVRP